MDSKFLEYCFILMIFANVSDILCISLKHFENHLNPVMLVFIG